MYLHQLKLWNFRKYATSDYSLIGQQNAGLTILFKPNLNILIGENNSGKTAIVDAIRYVLGTQSYDYQRLEDRDFYGTGDDRKSHLRIECLFKGFDDCEAAGLLEWLGLDEENNHFLKVTLTASRRDNRVFSDIKAGPDDEGVAMDGAARDLLRVTYLKPLRDADAELSPGARSRLTQILRSDPIFKKVRNPAGFYDKHPLEVYLSKANKNVKTYFEKETLDMHEDILADTKGGKHIQDKIQKHLKSFLHRGAKEEPFFEVSGNDLLDILHSLGLNLENNKTGLGLLNQLYMAAELILLQRDSHNGLRLCLIEEMEAHLHPQAQLRMIEFLKNKEYRDDQFILTTHSTTLASKTDLDNLILCYEEKVFPLHKGLTALSGDDYQFLARFLDATKANLFFAKGVILVEGDAENIFLPVIAGLLDRPLHEYGVSVVNVGSKALLRYAKILMKADQSFSPIKVSVITDLDIAKFRDNDGQIKSKKRKYNNAVPDKNQEIDRLMKTFNTTDKRVMVFPSPEWTFEYDLATGGLGWLLFKAVKAAEFSQNRVKNGNFNSLSKGDYVTILKKAIKEYNSLKVFYPSGGADIAFETYQKLELKKASKAVTAQIFSELLLLHPERYAKILKSDTFLAYIRDAIYHVTAPDED